MEETKGVPSRQHPYENAATDMQRRYSFSSASMEAIGQGKRLLNGDENTNKSPRKMSSFPTMIEKNKIMGREIDVKMKQKQKEEQSARDTGAPEPNARPVGDISLEIDIKGHAQRFSDDDSDGASSYSSVCSLDENSPTPSDSSAASSSCTSSSPLLRLVPGAGFEVLSSEASEQSSLDSVHQETLLEKELLTEKSKFHQAEPQIRSSSPDEKDWVRESEISSEKPQRAKVEKDMADSDDDLPDWLNQRIVLSPAASISKVSMRSPQQIEDEIRHAVDSAAARIQQELGRRERFQSDLETAASYSPKFPIIDSQCAAPQQPLSSSNNFDNVSREPPSTCHDEKAVHTQMIQDANAIDPEDCDLLLLMEVVIGDGRTETIEIREGDDPNALATAFVQKHSLKPDAAPKLVLLIQEQLNALAEAETEEATQSGSKVQTDWMHEPTLDEFLNSPFSLPTSTVVPKTGIPSNPSSPAHVEASFQPQQSHEPDKYREYNYNNLMAKYGHYSQHSGKIDPDARGARLAASSDTLAPRALQMDQYTHATGLPERMSASSTAPAFTTVVSASRNNSTKKKDNVASAPAYERLYALAESKQKWIKRAQKAKEMDQARYQEKMHKVELMAAKSRELIANRTNGGYAHIGERLHDEALSDLAKKVQRHERRAAERDQQQDWMCPKCAFVNQYSETKCQNVVALAGQPPQTRHVRSPTASSSGQREATSSTNSSFGFLEAHPEVLCGQPKPERLFQPTLLTTSAGIMKAVSANKEKSARMASIRRQRHQLALEEEFQQTCPFRPKINSVSVEIVREKLETAAAAAAVHGETRLKRNPHLELYEDSFHARAQREEQEQAYLKQFSFKPDIGVNALWVAPDRSQSDFVERLAVDKYHELERKRIALYDKYAPDRDPHTGKELFKPEVGRAPAFARNKQGLPIGDFLHAAHREQQEYHRKLREKDQREIKQKARQNFVSEASRQALERRKIDTCSRMFKTLLALSRQRSSLTTFIPDVSDAEPLKQIAAEPEQQEVNHEKHESMNSEPEVVIPAQIDLAALPAEISRVVAIVFEFAKHTPITRSDFLKYVDRLVREVPGLTYTEIIFLAEHLHDGKHSRHRHQLHHSDLEREAALAAAEEQELTFHPVIDKNSREIAMKHGRVSRSKVFNALNQYFEHYSERKEQLRKQQQREFKRRHPFRPTFVTRAHQREPVAAAFYDKIRLGNSEDTGNSASWGATASESSAPTSYRQPGAPQALPAPLHTALSNARPFVRPIESKRFRFYSAAGPDEAQLDETSGTSSSSSQLLEEDAELTFRVLAALDEKPSVMKPTLASPPCSYHFLPHEKSLSTKVDEANCMGKLEAVRSPDPVTYNI